MRSPHHSQGRKNPYEVNELNLYFGSENIRDHLETMCLGAGVTSWRFILPGQNRKEFRRLLGIPTTSIERRSNTLLSIQLCEGPFCFGREGLLESVGQGLIKRLARVGFLFGLELRHPENKKANPGRAAVSMRFPEAGRWVVLVRRATALQQNPAHGKLPRSRRMRHCDRGGNHRQL